jgi:hypothetical protein
VILIRIALIAGAALVLAAGARGDGDPASDVLYLKTVYFPYPPPSANATNALRRAVAAVYAHRYRVKVAVIASESDLGSVPELFNKPDAYARFLGSEIRSFYIGPLLIVMRAGFGIYDGGRSTAAEERVLQTVAVDTAGTDALVVSAAAAVDKLRTAGALKSKDIKKPELQAYAVSGHPGKPAALKFFVYDDSGSVRERIVITTASGRKVATLQRPLAPVNPVEMKTVRWTVPARPPSRRLLYCVTAIDPSGNRSRTACADLTVV